MWNSGIPSASLRALSRSWLGQALAGAVMFGVSGATITSCSKVGNDELSNGLYGLRVSAVAGDQQLCRPGILCKVPIKVQVRDSLSNNPVALQSVTFKQLGGNDIILLTPTIFTDANGYAFTQVKMPPSPASSYQIQGGVDGTGASTIFNITTDTVGGGLRIFADTTHNNAEVAGVPFGFVVRIMDDYGNPVTTYNGTVNLVWAIQAANSWDGTPPVLPNGTLSCTFTNGVCNTPTTYYLTDSANGAVLNVGDGPGGFEDLFNKQITVATNVQAKLVITDKPGGPNGLDGNLATTADNATVLNKPLVIKADAPQQTYFAAITDGWGNYIVDATNASWTSAATQISNYITPTANSDLTHFTPTQLVVNGILKANVAGLNSASTTITVDPGAPASLVVTTQNNQSESAGIKFALRASAVDIHGNLCQRNADGSGGYNGNFAVTVQMSNDTSGPPVSAGCNRFLAPSESYFNTAGNCRTRTYTQTFVDGVASLNMYGLLNDATNVTPTITMTTTAAAGFNSITGTTPVITVTRGPADHIELDQTLGGNGDFICDLNTEQQSVTQALSCISHKAGDSATTYYPALVDRAGNFISNPTPTWTFLGTYYGGDWSVASGASAASATFTPTIGGWGHVVLNDSASGVSTNIGGQTTVAPIDHFQLSVSDGTDTINNLSVLIPYTLTIDVRDASNNHYPLNGNYAVSVTYTGQHPSPKGTAPVIPISGMQTLNFVNGYATISTGNAGAALRLPNASDVVNITLTDGTHGSNTLNPALIPGPLNTLKIKTGPNSTGTDITGAAVSITTDNAPTYYMGLYDSEWNYLGIDNTATWNGSILTYANVTSPQGATVLSPFNVGSGILTVSSNSLSASTGTITIGPGTLDHLTLTTTHSNIETAGQAFSLIVKIYDRRNNLATYYSGTRSLSWIFTTQPSWSGTMPTLPPTTANCNFVNGVCTLTGVTLTDSRQVTKISVTDGVIFGVNNQQVTVNSGAKAALVLAQNAPGNTGQTIVGTNSPSAGWVEYCGNGTMSIPCANPHFFASDDSAAFKVKAAAVDAAGNYVEDAPYAVWSGSAPFLTNAISPAAGSVVTFTAAGPGTGTLTISDGGSGANLTALSLPLKIYAGAPAAWSVATQHGNVETAGVQFKVLLSMVDSKGNPITGYSTTPINGTFSVTMGLAGDYSAPMVTGGCGQVSIGGGGNPPTVGPCGLSSLLQLTILDGTANIAGSNLNGLLNDATGVSPTITASSTAQNGVNALSGTSPIITVNLGPPTNLVPHLGPTASDPPMCWGGYFQMPGTMNPCETATAGDPATTFYLAVEDQGGNVLSWPTTVAWNPSGAYSNDWSPISGASSTFTPRTAGNGILNLAAAGLNTVIYGTTYHAVIDHYEMTANDNNDPINSVSARLPFTLAIRAVDRFGNTISAINGTTSVTMNTTGATASAAGTSPILPPQGTTSLNFINGIATISGLRLPNTSNNVTFNVTDGTKAGTLNPILVPGPFSSAQIRDQFQGRGNNLTNQAQSYNTNQNPVFYLAQYDSELNYIGSDNSAAWTWTNSAIATINTPGANTTLAITQTGTGTLGVTTAGATISTGLITITAGPPTKYLAQTTHGNAESAGTTFGFKVTALDSHNNIATQVNGPVTLNWTVDSWLSWSGMAPTVPNGNVSCTFTNGVCNTATNYVVYDARRASAFSVSDGVLSPYAGTFTVAAGAKTALVIANRPGGPNGLDGNPLTPADNASVYNGTQLCTNTQFPTCVSTVYNADQASQTFYAAAVDAYGNYIEDPAAYVTWSGTLPYISSHLTPSGSHVAFAPFQTGTTGNLTASGGGLTAGTYQLRVDPGAANHFAVATQNGQNEVAGVSFKVIITAQDAKNNTLIQHVDGTGAYNGGVTLTLTFAGDASAPPVDGGCGRFYQQNFWDNFDVPNFTTDSCAHSFSYALNFVNGVADSSSASLYAILSDATSVSPTINASAGAFGSFPALSGTSPVIAMSIGPPAKLVPHATLGNNGDFACDWKTQANWTMNGQVCIHKLTGDPAKTWYAALEDQGGNFLSNPSNVTWTADGSGAGNWNPTTNTQSSTFTPAVGGTSHLNLSNGTISTDFRNVTDYLPVTHYQLTANDGTDPLNNLSVLSTFNLQIAAKDMYNNTIPINNAADSLNIAFTGAHASPLGTAVVAPATGFQSYNMVNGVVNLSGLRLPNSSDTVTVTVTDGTNTGSLSPTLLAGPPTSLAIRTAGNNGGSSITNQAVTVTGDQTPTWFVAPYDAQLNYITTYPASATWSFSNTSVGTVTSPGGSTTFSPLIAGTGVLTLSYAGLNAQTGTVTVTSGVATHYLAKTTHNNTEVAGAPFGFVVKVLDAKGIVVTSVNGPQSLVWSYSSWYSWTGQAPSMPTGTISCTFTNGVCTTPTTYYLTDARQSSTFTVGDGPGGLVDDTEVVTVAKGAKTALVIADKPGGPLGLDGSLATTGDNANILQSPGTPTDCSSSTAYVCTLQTYSADLASAKFYAAAVDAYGNYVEDATYAVWSASQPYLSSYLAFSGAQATLTPTTTGNNGTLTASYAGLTSGNFLVAVDPGAPNHLAVVTQNSGTESPGVAFAVTVTAEDAKNNPLVAHYDGTQAFTGNFTTSFTFANDATFPPVDGGCGRLYRLSTSPWQNFVVPDFSSVFCGRTYNYTLSYINGVANTGNHGIYALLNDATGTTPTISTQTAAQNGFSTLTGITPTISLSIGPDARLVPFTSSGNTGTFACDQKVQSYNNYTDPYTCITNNSGAPATTYYAALEDAGGNFKSNAAVTWTGADAYSTNWNPTTSSITSMLTPVTSGNGTITLSNGTISTKVKGVTNVSPLDHFTVTASDVTDPTNTVSAVLGYSLMVTARDASNNVVPLNSATNLTISYSGTHASPAGTAPILPPAGSQPYNFSNGVATISNLRLPNATDTVSINVTDGTHAGSLSPTLIPGTPTSIEIRDGGTNTGSNLTNQAVTITADQTPIYYLARYDSELNYVDGNPQGSWSMINQTASLGTIGSPTASFTQFTPNQAGTGNLKVTWNGLSAQTGTFTVHPGNLDHLAVATQHGGTEAAGTAFTVTVTEQDKNNNTVLFTGSTFVSFSVINNNNSPRGGTNTVPASGTLAFSNGVLSGQNFLFRNASVQPIIQVNASGKTGQTTVTVSPGAFDSYTSARASATINAGANHTWTISATDADGNILTTGLAASAPVRAYFLSALGGQDINGTTLASASSVAGPSDSSVTGNLVNGVATVTGTATQAGLFQLRVQANGCSGGNCPANPANSSFTDPTVMPLSTISSLAYKAGATPPSIYTASGAIQIDGVSSAAPMSTITVQALDIYGNVITTNSSTVITLSAPTASRALIGTLNKTLTSGEASFTNIGYPRVESIQLKASEPGGNSVTSATINVTVGAATTAIVRLPGQTYTSGWTSLSSAITGTAFSGGSPQAGTSFNVDLILVDSGYNPITSFNGQGRAASSDANYVQVAYGAFSSGQMLNVPVTLTTAGSFTISADTNGVAPAQASPAFTVLPGAFSQIALTLPGQTLKAGVSSPTYLGAASTPVAGSPFTVTASLMDAYFNVITTDNSTKINLAQNSTPTDGSITLPGAEVTASLGVVNFTNAVTYRTANTGYSLRPTSSNASGSPTLRATPTFNVLGAGADHLAAVTTTTPTAVVNNVTPVTVRVLDAYGNPISGTNVNFSITAPARGSTLSAATVASAASTGNASSNYTLPTSSGTNTVVASAALPGVPNSISFTVTENPDVANKVAFTTPPATSAAAGANFTTQPVVQIQDQWGNLILNTDGKASATVTLTAYSNSLCTIADGGTLNGGSMNATNGSASFTGASYTKADTFYVGAAVTGLTSGCTAGAITQNPAAPSKLVFVAAPTSISAGSCQALTITSQDSNGNLSPISVGSPTTITLGSTGSGAYYSDSGCGTGSGTVTLAANTSTTPTFWYKDNTMETTSLSATGGSLSSTARSMTITAATATQLVVTPGSGTFAAGGCSGTLTVTAKDTFGNPASISGSGATTLTLVSSTGHGTFYSTTNCSSSSTTTLSLPANSSNMTFSFSDTVTETTQVSVTSGALSHPTSAFTITPAALNGFTVAVQQSGSTITNITAGGTADLLVTALDTFGNVKTDFTGSVTLTSSDTQAVLSAPVTFVGGNNGVQTVSGGVVFKTAGSQTVTATSGGKSGTSSGVTVGHAAATQLVAVGVPGTATAGTSFTAGTLQYQDQYGNVDTSIGAATTVNLAAKIGSCAGSAATGTLTSSSPYAASSGQISVTGVSYTKAEAIYLNATSSDAKSACLGPITVNAGALNKLNFTNSAIPSTTAGAAFSPQPVVAGQDANGNSVALTGTVTLAPYGDSGCATTPLTAANLVNSSAVASGGIGTFSGTNFTKSGTIYLKAGNGGATGCSAAITVTAGTATTIAIQSGNTQSGTVATALGSPLVVLVTDANSNPVSGVAVTFAMHAGTSVPGTGTFGSASTTTNASGQAQTTYTLATLAGTNSIDATAAGVGSGVTFSETGIPGSPASLSFSVQPAGPQVINVALPTQPTVKVLDSYGNVSGTSVTVALAPFSGSGCLTAPTGTLGGTTSGTGTTVAFSGISYSVAQAISIQATSSGLASACSSGTIQIYPALSISAATSTPNASQGDLLTVTGGVPGMSFTVLAPSAPAINSGGSLGAPTTCSGNPCVTFTTGPIGGTGSNAVSDIIRVTDGAGNQATASLAVTGAHLMTIIGAAKATSFDFGSQFTDANVTVIIHNYGNATSDPMSVSLGNFSGGVSGIWTGMNFANCNGVALASGASCNVQVYFNASSYAAAAAGAYSSTLAITTPSNGGTANFALTGTKVPPP